MSDNSHLDGETLENKVEISREELEEMRLVQENSITAKGDQSYAGVGMLLIAYASRRVPGKWIYFTDHSPYVRENDLKFSTYRGWFEGRQLFPLVHMRALVDELEVSDEHLHFVAERNPFKPTEEDLERWSESNTSLGDLMTFYMELHSASRVTYLKERSAYLKERDITHEVVVDRLNGKRPFRLYDIWNFVKELEIPEDELKKVCGRDPFKPTDEELEEWSKDKKKFRKLFTFYADLRKGLSLRGYKYSSGYIKDEKVEGAVNSWFNGGNPFPPKHLRHFVEDLEVPEDELKKVCGRDPFKPKDEELEMWSEEKGGIGELLSFYIDLNHGERYTDYINKHSEYARTSNVSIRAFYHWMSGDSRFPLLPLKHFVEELKVPKDELEKVCGRNPFEVTEEELEEWSMDRKGIGKLFRFYADLNYGVNISEYLRKHSEHIKSEELRVETVTTNWLVGATTFPPKHLKGLANELEIPPDYVQRVTGVDLGEVKTTAEELDAAIAEFLDE